MAETVDRTYEIENAEPLLLFGFNDVYLRKIEEAFPETRVVARGSRLHLRGPEADLDRIVRVVDELVVILNRNGTLTENDVATVLDLSSVRAGARPGSGADAILFTHTGGTVKAKTPGQSQLVESARKNDIVFAVGPAGTGKTYTAVALAVSALKSRQVKKIVLCRPAVEAGESLGFLPGDLRDKVDPYLRPLYDALDEMVPREKLRAYLDQDVVEIVPLAYMRGRTLNSAFVILDEAQNATGSQMKMFLTRIGAGSRAIVTGDVTQTDLPNRRMSGLVQARQILEGVDGIGFIDFGKGDVVRHKLVKNIIAAYERAGEE
ncbi:MAG: PhoH family protein [Bacteroidota bacterium]